MYAPYTLQIVVRSRLAEEARRAERDRLRRGAHVRHASRWRSLAARRRHA